MKTKNLNDLAVLRDKIRTNEWTKVEYDNTPLKFYEDRTANYQVSFHNEINKDNSISLNHKDILRLKKWVTTYGYWFDKQKQTISINGNIFNILKVKDRTNHYFIYLKNIITGEIKNMQKEFNIAIFLNTSKLAKKILNASINSENNINKQFEMNKLKLQN